MTNTMSKKEIDRIFSELDRKHKWKKRVRKLDTPEKVEFT